MCDEYLTGPALHRAIADAQEAGEGPGSFLIKNRHGNFFDPELWDTLIRADLNSELIRRKPRMRHLTDMHGQRWEWPEPMQEIPEFGTAYYSTYERIRNKLNVHSWTNTPEDHWNLKNGFCQKTENGVIQHALALIAASGCNVD